MKYKAVKFLRMDLRLICFLILFTLSVIPESKSQRSTQLLAPLKYEQEIELDKEQKKELKKAYMNYDTEIENFRYSFESLSRIEKPYQILIDNFNQQVQNILSEYQFSKLVKIKTEKDSIRLAKKRLRFYKSMQSPPFQELKITKEEANKLFNGESLRRFEMRMSKSEYFKYMSEQISERISKEKGELFYKMNMDTYEEMEAPIIDELEIMLLSHNRIIDLYENELLPLLIKIRKIITLKERETQEIQLDSIRIYRDAGIELGIDIRRLNNFDFVSAKGKVFSENTISLYRRALKNNMLSSFWGYEVEEIAEICLLKKAILKLVDQNKEQVTFALNDYIMEIEKLINNKFKNNEKKEDDFIDFDIYIYDENKNFTDTFILNFLLLDSE